MIIGKAQYEEYLSNFTDKKVFFSINEGENYIKNTNASSVVLSLKLCNLYGAINTLKQKTINSYLKNFYSKSLPIISNKYGGKVDQISAQYIVAVFSDNFKFRNTTYSDILKDAYSCAKELITTLKANKYYANISIAMGNLCFCQVSDTEVLFDEVVCVGEPMILANKLLNIANANEILIPENISDMVYADNELRVSWSITSQTCNFSDVGNYYIKRLIKL
ncbi:hypothetical protein [Brachyspira pilosicoli]|uniref:Guanylate cyclase domain-containing protein n=1 Tax=Brachyspira pilosicoli TaxID=52584 RepID=A0A5C8EZ58_BRAPL|nr:hypothetical protein [Brachyspira pilosicoli]TXJ42142.1 hypothetical protein EPJ72_05475 [Brachyspira pilosicoli]